MKFLDRLWGLFGRGGREPKVRWLEANENAFGIRVLDCRPFTQNALSTVKDPAIAETAARLRSSTGEEYRGTEPEGSAEVSCKLSYPYESARHREGPVFRGQEMEDKWDIYLYDDTLFFARSWTGQLVYQAAVSFEDNPMVVRSILRAGSLADESDDQIVLIVRLQFAHDIDAR